MSLFSIFSNKPPEATSVAEALAGAPAPAKAKSRRSENRRESAEEQQLIPEKKRARRRLIGAVAIVLAVVIGLPMVLDSEPKPLNKNIVIQIPSKDAVSPVSEAKVETGPGDTPHPAVVLPLPGPAETPATVNTPVETDTPSKTANLDIAKHTTDAAVKKEPAKSKPEPKSDSKTTGKSENKTETKTEAKTKTKTDNKPADTHTATNNESARAMAILGGADTVVKVVNSTQKPAQKPTMKIVIQVGAFATQEKVTELQSKLSAAGIKSFTQKVATSTGDKIRVRVGPFADHESAAKIKAQLDKLGINGTLLSL